MACSEARQSANRENARKSTGPRTEEGKARSRENALKHGLTGAGVVLPSAMADDVRERQRGFAEDLRPGNHVEREVVRVMALASVRADVAFKMESDLVAANRACDLQLWDEQRAEAAERLGAKLADDPALTVIMLRKTSAGCGWLADRWDTLGLGLGEDACHWTDADLNRAIDLLGVRPEERALDSRARELTRDWQASRGEGPDAAAALGALKSLVRERSAELITRADCLFHSNEMLDYRILESGSRFDISREVRQLRSMHFGSLRQFFRCLDAMKNRPEAPGQTVSPVRPRTATVRTSLNPGLASGVGDKATPRSAVARPTRQAPADDPALAPDGKPSWPPADLLPGISESYAPICVGRAIAV